MELGFIDGMNAEVIGRAPLGDPLHVRVGDCNLSLRASEAKLIDIAHA
jgi:Fe2+ transport system protein FeoA